MGLIDGIRSMFQGPSISEDLDPVLDRPLLHLTETDSWTVRDAVGGTVIMGGPGSGKSSGPGRHLAMAFLEAGFGGMVLCAKPGEAEKWQTYAQAAGRSDDVVLFSPEYPELRFNPLAWELSRSGRGAGYTMNVTALFKQLLEIAEGSKQGSDKDPFFRRATEELLSYCTDVLHQSGQPVSLLAIHRLIQSCPKRDDTIDEFYDDGWRNSSFCFACLGTAAERQTEDNHDLEMAAAYLVEEFPALSDRTRTSILATFKGIAQPFMRSPMREMFGDDTTLRLTDIFDRRAIVIIDYPLREFGHVGRVASGLMKYSFMTEVERREILPSTQPCFLFVDEAQEFLTSHDARFMATARESRCMTVFLTQNLSGLYSAISSPNAKHVADALLANFMTKIWSSNADAITNQWAADLIAQSWQMKGGTSLNMGEHTSTGSSINEQLAYQVLPGTFTTLQKGGPPHFAVETIFFQGGKVFSTSGATFARILFPQNPT